MAKKKLLLARAAAAGAPEGALVEIVAPARESGAAPGLWTPEDVAQELGVSASRVMAVIGESCAVGVDVIARPDETVGVTAAGLEKIRGLIDAEMAQEKPAPAAAAPVIALPKTEDLRVTRIWGKKRVLCNRVSNGLEVVCRVQDSDNLMPGMVLPAAHAESGGVWSYYGRLPRRRGKW